MKRAILITILISVPLIKLFAQANALNGNWQSDTGKTNFKGAPRYAIPVAYGISYDANEVSIIRTAASGPDILHTDSIKLTPGSGSCENHSGTGRRQVFKLQVSADNKNLTPDIQSFQSDGSPCLHIREMLKLNAGSDPEVSRSVDQSDGFKYAIVGIYSKS